MLEWVFGGLANHPLMWQKVNVSSIGFLHAKVKQCLTLQLQGSLITETGKKSWICMIRMHSRCDGLQLAKAYVESIRIPGAEFTYKPLSWAAPPYSMAKDNLPNRAAAKVLEDMLGSPPVYFRCAACLTAES